MQEIPVVPPPEGRPPAAPPFRVDEVDRDTAVPALERDEMPGPPLRWCRASLCSTVVDMETLFGVVLILGFPVFAVCYGFAHRARHPEVRGKGLRSTGEDSWGSL